MTPFSQFKRTFQLLLLCNVLAGCSFVYIKAIDFRLEEYIKPPIIGSKMIYKERFSFPFQIPLIYEANKKRFKFIEVRVENYNSHNDIFYISYFYNSLKIQDDLISDDETFPIVRGSNQKVIGYGWQFVDSLKQIRFLDRMKN